MMNKIAETVSGSDVVAWLAIALLVAYFCYKEWPEFKRRVSGGALDEQKRKSIDDRLADIEKHLEAIDEKLQSDYDRINDIREETDHNKRAVEASMEEREIIMRSLLGVLGGLQEIGANGPTKAAQKEINDYLNRQAHKPVE